MIVDAGIEVSKIEEVIAQFSDGNVTAEFGVTFVGGIAEVTAKQVHSPELRVVCVEGCGLHPQRMEVAAHFAMGLGTAGLGDDLHDAAAGMPILRLKPAGLDLHFLDERLVNAAAQRPVGPRPNAQPPEGGVIDGNAVSHIGILESAGPRNGRIVAAGLNTIDCARAEIKQVGNAALHRNILEEGVGDVRRNSRGGSVYGDRGGADFHGFSDLARFEDNFDAGGLINLDFGALYAGDLEAWFLHFDRINAGNQSGEKEGSLIRRRLRQTSDRTRDCDLGSRNGSFGGVINNAAQIAACSPLVLSCGRR